MLEPVSFDLLVGSQLLDLLGSTASVAFHEGLQGSRISTAIEGGERWVRNPNHQLPELFPEPINRDGIIRGRGFCLQQVG